MKFEYSIELLNKNLIEKLNEVIPDTLSINYTRLDNNFCIKILEKEPVKSSYYYYYVKGTLRDFFRNIDEHVCSKISYKNLCRINIKENGILNVSVDSKESFLKIKEILNKAFKDDIEGFNYGLQFAVPIKIEVINNETYITTFKDGSSYESYVTVGNHITKEEFEILKGNIYGK